MWYFKHYGGGPFGSKGIPDLLGIRTVRVDKLVEAKIEMVGIGFVVEVKRDEKDRPTKEQAAVLVERACSAWEGAIAGSPPRRPSRPPQAREEVDRAAA